MTEKTNSNAPNSDPKQWTDENGVDWVEYTDGKRFYFDKDKNDWAEWQNAESVTLEEGVPVTENAGGTLEQPMQEAQTVAPSKPKIKIDINKIKANIKYIIAAAVVVVAGVAGIVAYNIVQSTGENASPENVLKAYIEALDVNDYEKALGLVYDQGNYSVDNILTFGDGRFPELVILGSDESETTKTTATLNIKLGSETYKMSFIKTDKIGWMVESPESTPEMFKWIHICRQYNVSAGTGAIGTCQYLPDFYSFSTIDGKALDAQTYYYLNPFSMPDDKDYTDFLKIRFKGTEALKEFEADYGEKWIGDLEYSGSPVISGFSDDFKKRLTAIANKFAYDTFTCSGDTKIATYSCDKDDGYTKTTHKLKKGFSVDKDCAIESTATELVESNFASFTVKCDFGAKTYSSYYDDTDLITTVTYKGNKLSYTIDGYEIDTSYDSDYYVYFESKTITVTE
ncbi:MAG: hypothetical protein LBL41_04550 [Bifidobacteriaceae bacterium]|jgi:hypothetical protein|nr:hypothetical protein [Bifidobacteriaceae bacterium]